MENKITNTNVINGRMSDLTPIEIMLEVDENGETTAKKLYEFLQMDKKNYSRWYKTNITENKYAEENVDFKPFVINEEWGGAKTIDYKLTASFAKKLCMTSQSERGNQARNYFIKVEDKLKKKSKSITTIAELTSNNFLAQQFQSMALMIGQYMEQNTETINKITDYVQESINTKDAQINEAMELIGLRDRNTKVLSTTLKDKLSDLIGRKINASSEVYKVTKNKVFREYKVSRWEDIAVGNFNSVYAYIDGLEKSEVRSYN